MTAHMNLQRINGVISGYIQFLTPLPPSMLLRSRVYIKDETNGFNFEKLDQIAGTLMPLIGEHFGPWFRSNQFAPIEKKADLDFQKKLSASFEELGLKGASFQHMGLDG